MAVLYRKYRPQCFGDVAGQEHVRRTLQEEVASGRLAHSYLFTGPRGVGKTTMARIVAKAVNCTERKDGEGEPCASCASCEAVTAGRALDIVEIDAASHTGVENVREQVIEHARFAPSEAKYKVFIIDEVHMLSSSAFNALLKTLEEPPEHVIFILATTELHKLPATVVSRCQRFDFRRIGRADLVARLKKLSEAEGISVQDDVLETVARQSEGCLRDAESLLSQIFSLGDKEVTPETAALVLPSLSSEAVCRLAAAVLERDAPAALSVWGELSSEGADLTRILDDLIDLTRQTALLGLKGREHAEMTFPLSTEWTERFSELRGRMSSGEMAALLERLLEVRAAMRRIDLVELPFEMMVMEWAVPSNSENGDQDPSERSRQEGQNSNGSNISPPVAPESCKDIRGPVGEKTSEPAPEPEEATPADAELFETVKKKWQSILERSQEKNKGLPYMLGVARLLGVEAGTLRIGFQYAMYRDRLNGKCKHMLEEVLSETIGASLLVQGELVEKREEDTGDDQRLPDGFSELVSEFGGTLAS